MAPPKKKETDDGSILDQEPEPEKEPTILPLVVKEEPIPEPEPVTEEPPPTLSEKESEALAALQSLHALRETLVDEATPAQPTHPALLPPTLFFPPGRLPMVESNATLRLIGQELANGTRFSAHPTVNFNVHDGLIIQMHSALDGYQKDIENVQIYEDRFFTALESYLTQAVGKIRGAVEGEERIKECIHNMRLVVHQVNASGQGRTDGFFQVARYLITLARAPLDHF